MEACCGFARYGLFAFRCCGKVVLVLGAGLGGLGAALSFRWAGWGWPGLAPVTAAVVYCQLGLLLLLAPKTDCWPGWDFARHVTWPRVREFSAMYFPAAFSTASDFWRVVAIGVVASAMGHVDLAVFK